MSKKTKILVFSLLTLVALIYVISPPRNLTIEITATPQGIQEFYVTTISSIPGFHGADVNNVDKRLVPVNQQIKIPLNRKKTHWFGRLSVDIYHPEYFGESKSTNNKFILPTVRLAPTAWTDALSTDQKIVDQQVYRPGVLGYRDLPMSHVNYHIWFVNNQFLDLYLQNSDQGKLYSSIEVLDLVVKKFIAGMLEENIGEYGPTNEMKEEINKAHIGLNEIHEKIN